MTTPLWPFAQLAEMTEVLEWRTDVIRARSAEQRTALRSAPRLSLQMSHLLRSDDVTAAHEILRYSDDVLVPEWARISRVGDVPSGLNVVVPVHAGAGLAEGDNALLWRSSRQYEAVEVAAVGAGTVTLDIVSSPMKDARLMPLRLMRSDAGMETRRAPGDFSWAQIEFEAVAPRSEPGGSWPQYRGHDLLTICPVVGDGTLDFGAAWPRERLDNETGAFALMRTRTRIDERMQMRWHVFGADDMWALRQWLNDRRGRQCAFWFSTFGRDFVPAATIGAADTSILVRKPAGLPALRVTFDIEIKSKAGTIWRRQVSSPTSSGSNWTLPIGTALGTTLVPEAAARISLLRCVRFDSDRIELLHRAGEGVAAAVPCVEVNIP